MRIDYLNAERYPDPTAFKALVNIDRAENPKFRPLVYVCSPYSGDTEHNVRAAQRYCRFVISQGCIPVAPHLLYPQFLDNEDEEERSLGQFCGKVLMSKCHEFWVFGNQISEGMQAEIRRAKYKGMRIRHFNSILKEVTWNDC